MQTVPINFNLIEKPMHYYLLVLVFISTVLLASENEVQDYNEIHKSYYGLGCIDEATQHSMDECGKEKLIEATKKMNDIVKIIAISYEKKSKEQKKALKKSQKHWVNLTKFDCAIETEDSQSGSGYYSILNACLEMKTNERISYLRWISSNL